MATKLNAMEIKLKEIYDNWELGREYESDDGYSCMFRMGFPDDFLVNGKPLIMYVGQECLGCDSKKTQSWIRLYQTVQLTKTKIETTEFSESTNKSPFWNFYRSLSLNENERKYNMLWNNLDKFHPSTKQQLDSSYAQKLNRPYGNDKLSVLQREIQLVKPDVIVLVIGKGKYTESLASAFSVDTSVLRQYEPTIEKPLNEISKFLNLEQCKVFWTYHPAYLQRKSMYRSVMDQIKMFL